MDANYFSSYVKVDLYLGKQEFKKCEMLLTNLINRNPDVTTADKTTMIELLKKRVLVYHRLRKHRLVLDDIQSLIARNVTIDWNNDIFDIQQEAILNCAVDEITKNLNENLCPLNELLFDSIIQFFDFTKSKDVFNKKTFNTAKTRKNGRKQLF